jgi:hypothetical protein
MSIRGSPLLTLVILSTLAGHRAVAQGNPLPRSSEAAVSVLATGTFDVKLAPLPAYGITPGSAGRMSIDKVFRGDLEATSQGEMLAAMTATQGSAGYVAIERVTGTLHGKTGTFVLQHSSTMTRGVPTQSVTVIPDSGTDGLTGLAGRMTIIIKDGKHRYEFEYTIAAP